MMQLNKETNVCDLVIANPRIAKVFDKYRIDYCCGGKLPLQEICLKRGIDCEAVWQEVQQAIAKNEDGGDLENLSLTELVNHILDTHHQYLREELPQIEKLMDKVLQRHGETYPEFQNLHAVFNQFLGEISEHMDKEEHILFPWICQIDGSAHNPDSCCADSHCGCIQNPIQVMEHEHESAGALLLEMRNLTKDYTAPADACNSVRVLFQKLHDLEIDMHRHVHKENYILFPKAIKMEEA